VTGSTSDPGHCTELSSDTLRIWVLTSHRSKEISSHHHHLVRVAELEGLVCQAGRLDPVQAQHADCVAQAVPHEQVPRGR